MPEDLLRRSVKRLPEGIRFDGRILLLVDDADLMRRQLDGEDLPGDPREYPLRDDISTDEITPGWVCFHFDETLGDFPYLGLRAGRAFPIARGAIRGGGFTVSVSGKRRGKGSSREQSPYAELAAGVRLVIAENIERIYRQNCQNLGMLTSTDFDLVRRIRAGEEIPLSEFTKDEDAITRQIVEFGGLFPFNVARFQGRATVPRITTPDRPMTLAEKIFASHMIVDAATGTRGVAAVRPGDAGFVDCDLRFSHEYVTPMAAAFFERAVGPGGRIRDPESVLFFRDHLTFLRKVISPEKKAQGLLDLADQLAIRQDRFAREQGVRLHGEMPRGEGSEGICHSLVLQNYALPGRLIAGTDSHTPHSGAIGALAFGVGTTDIMNAWITRDVRVRVPGNVRVRVHGRCPGNVAAKDIMLALLAHPYVKGGSAIGKVIEYAGEAIEELDVDERATLTNMAAEVGAMTGIVAPDARTARYLVRERGLREADADRLCEGWASDPDATWEEILEIDASALRPMVALPGDPGNGRTLEELERENGPVPIEIAYGGSCTAGKKEDMDMYARVLADGLRRGRKVAPGVAFYIQFGSQEVKAYCRDRGYLEIFAAAGAQVIEPSCGACINAGPGVSRTPETVTVSAINRNFPGRSGPGRMYLASPLTVAASALAGRIVEYRPEDPI